MSITTAGSGLRALCLGFALATLGVPAVADSPTWDCDGVMCVQTDPQHLGTLEGYAEYAANASVSMQGDLIEALRAQRYRVAYFDVPSDAYIRADGYKEEGYVPSDWPADIGLADKSHDVELWLMNPDGSRSALDNGARVPAGSRLQLVVVMPSGGTSAYITFFPVHWFVDISYRLIRDDSPDAPMPAAPYPVGDPVPGWMPGAVDLADGACRDRECREPDPVRVPQDDPSVALDPSGQDCGDGLLECRPPPDPTPLGSDEIKPKPDCAPGDADCTAPGTPDTGTAGLDASLAADLQAELARFGCYNAAIDGVWGAGSVQALTNYNHWHGSTWDVQAPSGETLMEMMLVTGPVCGVD